MRPSSGAAAPSFRDALKLLRSLLGPGQFLSQLSIAPASPEGRLRTDSKADPSSRTALLQPVALDYYSSRMTPTRPPGPPNNPFVRELVQAKRVRTQPLPKSIKQAGFAGWHENGYLPHRDEPGLTQFITFRLVDAFPAELRHEWDALLKIEEDRARRIQLEAYLDKGRGECHLKQPGTAEMVETSLRFGHGKDYNLKAWVLMPNHVHLLVGISTKPMSKLVEQWKGFTAKKVNKLLGRSGSFWQAGYWDTYMRDEEHEIQTRRYIENNPMKAGLFTAPEQWLWSSARFRDRYAQLQMPA